MIRQVIVQVSAAMKMPGGGMLKVGPGQVTDDSEMALSLAHALIGHEASQLQGAAAEMYVKWLNSKPFDVGKQSAPLDSTHTCQAVCHTHLTGNLPSLNLLCMAGATTRNALSAGLYAQQKGESKSSIASSMVTAAAAVRNKLT